MKHKRFKIKGLRTKQYFWVYVYDELEDIRKASDDFISNSEYKLKDNWSLCYGTCHPYERILIDPKKKTETVLDNVGIIRLANKHVSDEVAAHEVMHVALHMYRLQYKRPANFGKACSENEENLAHLYGELFESMTDKLYKYGIWE